MLAKAKGAKRTLRVNDKNTGEVTLGAETAWRVKVEAKAPQRGWRGVVLMQE
jgi:hypothetical protein